MAARASLNKVLSPRQVEVLDLVAMGLSRKEVSARLGISLNTVKKHMKGILRKGLNGEVDSTAKLVAALYGPKG